MSTIRLERAMRLIQIPLLLALAATPSLAQRPAIGVSLGVNRSFVTGGEVGSDGDAGTGVGFGISIRQSVTSWLHLEPELAVSLRRSGTRGVRLRMTTMQLPVLLRAGLPSVGSAILPFIAVGPAVSIRLACSRWTDDGAGGELTDRCDGIQSSPLIDPLPGLPAIQSTEFQTWDLSLVAGAGIETNGVVMQVRVERGLRKVEKSIPFPMSQLDGSRLLNLAFSVGIWLPSLKR